MATSNVPADLGAEIHEIHTIDALLAGVVALANSEGEFGEIKKVCEVARQRLDVVRNNLDLIDIGRGAEVQHG